MYSVYTAVVFVVFFFFKQKTAYEMRISDWSSDVCSSDLLCQKGDGGILTVSTSPSLAVKWLIPRLGRFYQGHPEVDLRIRPDPAVVDLPAEADSIDMAIRLGQEGFPGLAATPFMHENVFAVASPELLAKDPPLRHQRNLHQPPPLHPASHPPQGN